MHTEITVSDVPGSSRRGRARRQVATGFGFTEGPVGDEGVRARPTSMGGAWQWPRMRAPSKKQDRNIITPISTEVAT